MTIDNGILARSRRPRQLDGIFSDSETGRELRGEEVLEMARELKAKGFEVVPVCDHHDERGHCLGHPVVEDEQQPVNLAFHAEEALLVDPGISHWLKEQIRLTRERDVVDALKDIEVLTRVLNSRLASLPESHQ